MRARLSARVRVCVCVRASVRGEPTSAINSHPTPLQALDNFASPKPRRALPPPTSSEEEEETVPPGLLPSAAKPDAVLAARKVVARKGSKKQRLPSSMLTASPAGAR